jgi:hypothetical protein
MCAQIEISFAIISATIPCLRPFMSSLNTHYGAPAKPKTTSGSGSNSNQMESLTKAGKTVVARRDTPVEKWAPRNLTRITRGGKSIDSQGSKQMIITKDTEWVVEYEGQGRIPQAIDRPTTVL